MAVGTHRYWMILFADVIYAYNPYKLHILKVEILDL